MQEFKVEEETRTEMIQIVKEETTGCDWDANADWRNGVLSTLSEDKPMAQVTYRGVKYDTDSRKETPSSKSDLTYRGVKHSSKVVNEFIPSYLNAA